ncbi:MAG: ABC transporter ATP-binding protein [Gammaproteobacteria bacterium]
MATAPQPPALEIANLRVDYGSFTAVDDLSLTMPPGEIFGLAGPNGAGKTSTIRVLASLLEPTYGEVRILGHDLFEAPERAREQLGYMPDLAPVVPNLKVWEFLDLYAQSHGYRGAEKRDRVDGCLAKVKLSDKRNVYGRALSRGMTQRVVLAKTLLHDPKLLLLDEPASGMDPIARRDLRRILEGLAANGASVVVSSHILSELSDMCTSVGIMHLGRLLQHGPMNLVLDSMRSDTVVVRIEVIEGIDSTVSWLEQRDDVAQIRVDGRRVHFSFQGDKPAQAALLASMVSQQIDIVAFSSSESGIESLLIQLIGDDAQ